MRIRLSRPAIVSVMTPSGQCPLGASVCRSTNSPTLMFRFSSIHLFLVVNVGRYSFLHLLQKCSRQIWMCFQRFLYDVANDYIFALVNTSSLLNPFRKWFGVSAFKSEGSSLIGVIGRLFTIFSTSVINVIS